MVISATEIIAHNPNQTYLYLRIYKDGIGGRFEINTLDLNKAFNLNLENGYTLSDLDPVMPRIKEYYLERTGFSSVYGDHEITFDTPDILRLEGLGDYLQLNFTLQGVDEVPDNLDIYYNVLFDVDPTSQCLQVIEYNWKAGIHNNEGISSLSFGPNETRKTLDLSEASLMQGMKTMIGSGMHHIFIGLDHILFLLALLLPGVVTRFSGNSETSTPTKLDNTVFPAALKSYATAWVPNESFRSSFIYVIKIVTFFTVAHTITLSLAALEVIKLPGVLVESIIAISIALAALNNIIPMLPQGREWLIAFIFGLFHGFGFASVLADVGLGGDYLVLSLLGFNIGVEVGQILIVAIIFPVLYLLRNTDLYRPILIYGSIFLILVALNWASDRGLGTDFPLDDFVEKIYGKILRRIL
jgi:hypothetical protein